MAPELNVCVYCGSGPGRNSAYLKAANTLGRQLAEAGIGLVYGGGSLGLMGEVARATLSSGGYVTGIIPEFLVQKERMLTDVNELIVTANMHERKMTMFERSDGFVALPGGVGTLEELVEITTWAQLDRHARPIILCNVLGYWNPLRSLFSHMRVEQFIREGLELRMDVVATAAEVIPAFDFRCENPHGKVAAEPIRKVL